MKLGASLYTIEPNRKKNNFSDIDCELSFKIANNMQQVHKGDPLIMQNISLRHKPWRSDYLPIKAFHLKATMQQCSMYNKVGLLQQQCDFV